MNGIFIEGLSVDANRDVGGVVAGNRFRECIVVINDCADPVIFTRRQIARYHQIAFEGIGLIATHRYGSRTDQTIQCGNSAVA